MTTSKKISVVIPLYFLHKRFIQDFQKFFELDYPDYEIIVVIDKGLSFKQESVKVLCTDKKKTSPAEKRDLALKEASGEILAFIDDDAYPAEDWIRNAIKYFDDENVGAVGGPGLTPPEDSFLMRSGGLCYESIFGSGVYQYRFTKGKPRTVDDLTAYNLFIRKSVLLKTGGYASTYYGGEDTKLCIEITKLGKLILYTPEVIVYHHMRPLFYRHLWQIGNIGLHRGYFVKRYPVTSRRISYFLPLIISAGFFTGLVLSFFRTDIAPFFFGAFLLILGVAFIDCLIRSKNIIMSIFATIGIFLMHIVYGMNFIRGLLKGELKT